MSAATLTSVNRPAMRRQASHLLDSRLAAIEAGATLAGRALVAVAVAVSAAVAEAVVVASVAPVVVVAAATATDKLVLFFWKENGSVSHFQANFRALAQ